MIENNIDLNLDPNMKSLVWIKHLSRDFQRYSLILDEKKLSHEFSKQIEQIKIAINKNKNITPLVMELNPSSDYEKVLCATMRSLSSLDSESQRIIFYSFLYPNKNEIKNLICKLKKTGYYRRRKAQTEIFKQNYFLILSC